VALALAVEACRGGAKATRGPWPNEPAGFTLISDYGLDDPFPIGQDIPVGSSGWRINNGGLVTRVVDATVPVSPSFVGQWSYPVGFAGGNDPGTLYKPVPSGINELYIGFYWKVSNPWQDHPVANKIAFQFAGGGGAGGQMFIAMWSGTHHLVAATEFSTDFRNLDPNVNATAVTIGQWHLIEIYMNKATHTMRWWLDNVLQGQYTDVNYPAQNFDEFKFAPTWGGTGSTKTEQDYFWYDQVRLSGRSRAG